MMSFIDAHCEDLGIEPTCRELAIDPSSYNEHARRLADPGRHPPRAHRDDEIMEQIKWVREASSGFYGARRVRPRLRLRTRALRWCRKSGQGVKLIPT
jgi:hypothetical protein